MTQSPGPLTAEDDEIYISRFSRAWLLALSVAPFVVAEFSDTKWVVATGAASVVFVLGVVLGYLDALCVRLRRTNIYLSGAVSTS